jgi:hypothetical protein
LSTLNVGPAVASIMPSVPSGHGVGRRSFSKKRTHRAPIGSGGRILVGRAETGQSKFRPTIWRIRAPSPFCLRT